MSEQMRGHIVRGSVGAIAAADVAYLSRSMVIDGALSVRDAEDLVAFNQWVVPQAPEWSAFFITAIAGHVLGDLAPAGEVDGEKCDWLMETFAPLGRVESPRAMPLLIRIMEGARTVSRRLPAFALMQLRAAIITGEGSALGGRAHFSRVVDEADVALIRRILIAGGGGEGRSISREEAEALFGIHDATIDAENDPGFAPLFLRAIAQHACAASGLVATPRGTALQPPVRRIGPRSVAELDAGEGGELAGLIAPVRLAAPVAGWLEDRILKNGRLSSAGRVLAETLIGRDATMGDTLRAMLDRAA
ncbi:hypothetical protein MWN34_19025 [Ancylobacter sp. 6x-1]|uniref:Uncharacterized protein n=1 Tax=Ancylobacter crimeensis TaxID=2579147 RepID=A0ABT0DGA3_9HYPH|nr:hypothetical protein [Ancylobacter crimeensis]MCK0198996.1 hypothetical protein [Ancylobacter crimeensis]